MISNEYAAGFFDADGSCYARKRTEGRSPAVTINISSVDRIILDLHKDRWGGSIAIRAARERCQTQYHWVLAGAMSRQYIEDIIEYTIIKRPQLELALKMRDIMDLPRRERIDYSVVEWSEKEQRHRHHPIIRPAIEAKISEIQLAIRALNKKHAPFNVRRHESAIS